MKILALSPHCDDIELACGGSVAKWKEQGHDITVIAYSYSDDSLPEHLKGAMLYEWKNAMTFLGIDHKHYNYNVRTFSDHRIEILQSMVDDRKKYRPDLVLIPPSLDIHQDHVIIHEEGVRAFSRICNVLAYDTPWSCRGFVPDHFEILREKHLEKKINACNFYKSQVELHRAYFNEELIRGHVRMTGLQVKNIFAEGFQTITSIND